MFENAGKDFFFEKKKQKTFCNCGIQRGWYQNPRQAGFLLLLCREKKQKFSNIFLYRAEKTVSVSFFAALIFHILIAIFLAIYFRLSGAGDTTLTLLPNLPNVAIAFAGVTTSYF